MKQFRGPPESPCSNDTQGSSIRALHPWWVSGLRPFLLAIYINKLCRYDFMPMAQSYQTVTKILFYVVSGTWHPDTTPSPPAHTIVSRAKLPHHECVEQMECSTTGSIATWRTEGAFPQSVEKSQQGGRMKYLVYSRRIVLFIYSHHPCSPSRWCNSWSH